MKDGCQCPGAPTIYINAAAGDSVCTRCGSVISENALVSEVTFGETAGGAAMAHGTLVAEGATHARTGGWRRGGEESNEQAIYNGRIRIAQVSTAMSIPDTIRDSALRFYKLAVAARFTKGRKSRLVVAACLYAACQRVRFGYMLIDFSDLLQVNVFVLGSTYLRLIKVLHLPRPHEIDPSHYVYRFASLLEFGDETHKVAEDASRLVRRFKADWMNTGRRPAGICGACLLLAARMNNFRRSVQEIVQVVKIADQTLLKRLEEFKSTGSSAMTVNDFRDEGNWEQLSNEAPPILKDQETKRLRRLARKRKRGELQEEAASERGDSPGKISQGDSQHDENSSFDARVPSPAQAPAPQPIDFNSGIFQDIGLGDEDLHPASLGVPSQINNRPLFVEEDPPDGRDDNPFGPPADFVIDPALYEEFIPIPDPTEEEGTETQEIANEVENVLHGTEGAQLTAELEEAEVQAATQRQANRELLDDLDEDELDQFLLTEEEVRIKTRVWCELNRDYLEKLAAKGLDEAGEEKAKKVLAKVKKPKQKPRDSTTARGATPAESVGHLLQKKTFSRKINYDAIKNLFKTPLAPSIPPSREFESDMGQDSAVDDEEKDDEVGLSTIDPDPDLHFESGHSAADEGEDRSFARGDYYDDGGYEEEV